LYPAPPAGRIEAQLLLPRHFLPPEFPLLTDEASTLIANNLIDAEKAPDIRGVRGGVPAQDMPQFNATPESLLRLQKTREKELINVAIMEAAGNVSRAARKLNISRQLLHYKMKKYRLQRDKYSG